MPRGGRPLVIANAIPAACNAFTAATARVVSTFSAVTRVPSTSARTSEIFEVGARELYHARPPARVASARLLEPPPPRMNRSTALAKPSSRLLSVTKSAALLHLRTGIAHGNAETAPLEHRDIVAAIADNGDLRQRNGQQLRDFRQCGAFVGERMGDVEVVWLRTSDGSIIGERGAHIALTPCEKLEIPADADDLGSTIEGGFEVLDDLRPKSHRPLLEADIRRVGVAHQPVLSAENPDLHPVRIEHVDRAPSDRG